MGGFAVQGVSTTVDEDLLHYLSLMDIANLIKTKKRLIYCSDRVKKSPVYEYCK